MTYQGVKFKTNIIDKKIPKDPRIEELKYWGKVFYDKNLAPLVEGGAAGNLSFRMMGNEDKFVITASGIDLGNLKDDCFTMIISCDFNKKEIYAEGVKTPSSESMLHWAIYQERKNVNVIFHGHCEEIMRYLDKLKIPETKKEEPYGTIELVQSILDILDDHNFLIRKNHGFISLGKTMQEVGELTLQIHKKCFK